jgi:hypothetical protein
MNQEQEEAGARFKSHLVAKATAARGRYGPHIDADAMLRMLDDRHVVRYPVHIAFDSGPLQPHEFAWPKPRGFHPSDGFCLFLHSRFEQRRESWPLLIAYHIPSINYGAIAGPEHAEIYGAVVLGLSVSSYHRELCALADLTRS